MPSELLIDSNSKSIAGETDIYSTENEIQKSLEGSEEINPSQFENTKDETNSNDLTDGMYLIS